MQAPGLTSRRAFSRAAWSAIVPKLRARRRIPIALQLFSVRDQCERNLVETLAAVRSFGYEGVEFAGFYGWRSPEIRELLHANSLTPCGSHTPLDQLTGDEFAETVAFNREIGNRNLIVPGFPPEYESLDGWIRAAALFNQLAEHLKPFGMRIGYHNHTRSSFSRSPTRSPGMSSSAGRSQR